MSAAEPDFQPDFFVAGGTLRGTTPSYVERPADADLYNATVAGEFCYVLTPRQMGKSSLMVRTARRLQQDGFRTVILDLTSIGTDVSPEQWYLGIVSRINSRLNRGFDLGAWWEEHNHLSVVQRFTDYLRLVMTEADRPAVIFIDEIDTTLSLPFRDDFFAAVRYFYNMRSETADMEKLSITMLGVATPADLISDRTRTPFNIGRRIELHEFTRKDAVLFEEGLVHRYPGRGSSVLDRIFYWTNGHPYLTQKLCLSVMESEAEVDTREDVDALVHELFLSEAARRETNLQFMRDNILSTQGTERRELLTLYRNVLRDKKEREDERSHVQNRLKLIGLLKGADGYLQVRNRVYETVFDESWIKEVMPVDWTRRVALAAIVAIALVALAAVYFVRASQQQTVERVIQDSQEQFDTGNPTTRLTSLATLYSWNEPETVRAANEMIDSLPVSEKLAIFSGSDLTGLDAQLVPVARAQMARLADSPEGDALLTALDEALAATTQPEADLLGRIVQSWKAGREALDSGETGTALRNYDVALLLTEDAPLPALYYDAGRLHTALENEALAVLYLFQATDPTMYESQTALAAVEGWHEPVQRFIADHAALLGHWYANQGEYSEYAAVAELLPVPTATPEPTATPTATPTPQIAVATNEAVALNETPSATNAVTATAVATDSATATVALETTNLSSSSSLEVLSNVFLREGPGLVYDIGGSAAAGETLEIIGRAPAGDWYNVRLASGDTAWISGGFVAVVGDVNTIDVVATVPPRPTATFTPRPTATLVPTAPVTSGGGGSSGGSGTGDSGGTGNDEPTPVPAPTDSVPTPPGF